MTHMGVGLTDTNRVRTSWHGWSGGRCRPVAHTGLLVRLSTYVLPCFFSPSLWLDRAMGLISDRWGIEWKWPRTLESQYVLSIPAFPWHSKSRNRMWFSRWRKPGPLSLNREEPLAFHKAFQEQKTNLCCVKPWSLQVKLLFWPSMAYPDWYQMCSHSVSGYLLSICYIPAATSTTVEILENATQSLLWKSLQWGFRDKTSTSNAGK